MRFPRDPLEEWALRSQGARICLDSSGTPSPWGEPSWSLDPHESMGEAEAEAVLREQLRRRYRVDDDMIALAGGAQHASFLFFLTHLGPGDLAAVENPTFMPLQQQAEAIASVRTFERPAHSAFAPDRAQVSELLDQGAKVVASTNLHNPSAAAMSTEVVSEIVDLAAKKGAMVLCDEVYREMAYGPIPRPAWELGENALSVSSVTKLHGLRTLRIGWLIGPPRVARRVEEARLISSYRLPVLSCRYAAEAVRRQEWFRDRALDRARENLPVLSAWTQAEERVDITPPQGALMALVRLPPGVDDQAFSEALLEKGVAVGPGRYWGILGAIRVTFSCPRPQFEEGLATISSTLDVLSK